MHDELCFLISAIRASRSCHSLVRLVVFSFACEYLCACVLFCSVDAIISVNKVYVEISIYVLTNSSWSRLFMFSAWHDTCCFNAILTHSDILSDVVVCGLSSILYHVNSRVQLEFVCEIFCKDCEYVWDRTRRNKKLMRNLDQSLCVVALLTNALAHARWFRSQSVDPQAKS